ncbi:MAG: hypothetical protein KDD38_04685 [Bdellovibrionales bacterium]|nr:hypothetical protein [Bdellovibrionales bacterium]
MFQKSIILSLVISTFILSGNFSNALTKAQQDKIGLDQEKPRTTIEVDTSNMMAHVTIKKEGTSVRAGGPDSRPACGLGRSARRDIRGSDTAQINEGLGQLLENTSSNVTLTVPEPLGMDESSSRNTSDAFRRPHFADRWRNITISNSVSSIGMNQVVELKMVDNIHEQISDSGKSTAREAGLFGSKIDCYRHNWNEFAEKDTLSGYLDVTYKVPEDVQFVKIEFENATGVFSKLDPNTNKSRVSLVNSIHNRISLEASTYAWYKTNDEGRIKIRYQFNGYSHGVGKSGLNAVSSVKLKITPIVLPVSTNLTQVFEDLIINLDDKARSEDEMVVDLGSLISMFEYQDERVSTAKVLGQKSLKEIREIQAELFDFAIRETNGGRKSFTPTTKAMAAVLATKISEHLSGKLLNICRVKSKELLLTRQRVELPGYVYLTFYIQRILKRLESYKAQDVYDFARVLAETETYSMTFQEVAKDSSLMEKLGVTYDIYEVLASAAGKPLRTSYGEMINLHYELGSLFNKPDQIQDVLKNLNIGMDLEKQIQIKINKVKRATISRPSAERFDSLGVWSDVTRLDQAVANSIESVNVFSQSSMFSEITKTGFRESMMEIFKGVNLREVDFPEGSEVYTFYSPIFDYFFSKKKMDKINSDSQLCLRGELK